MKLADINELVVLSDSNNIRCLDRNHARACTSTWAIVLAGGEGTRMQAAIQRWFGEDRPKQFCSFTGRHSMLEHTWMRAKAIVPENNIVTIAVKHHKPYFEQLSKSDIPGHLLYQPESRGTAAAVYLGLSYILGKDPNAAVILLPSDHFIYPGDRFARLAKAAFHQIEFSPEHALLLGARPSWANSDYGWMDLAVRSYSEAKAYMDIAEPIVVKGFYEKPQKRLAETLYHCGALWSTMILVARADLLWSLGCLHFPANFSRKLGYLREVVEFGHARGALHPVYTELAVLLSYCGLPAIDFSSDLLRKSVDNFVAMPMQGIEWDDWGRPERIIDTIQRQGLVPTFKENAFKSFVPVI